MRKYIHKNEPNTIVLAKPMALDVYNKITDPDGEDLPSECGYWVEDFAYPVQLELKGKAMAEVHWLSADVFHILYRPVD